MSSSEDSSITKPLICNNAYARISCPCGGVYNKYNKKEHDNTQKHQYYERTGEKYTPKCYSKDHIRLYQKEFQQKQKELKVNLIQENEQLKHENESLRQEIQELKQRLEKKTSRK
jgi:hypothetical protein